MQRCGRLLRLASQRGQRVLGKGKDRFTSNLTSKAGPENRHSEGVRVGFAQSLRWTLGFAAAGTAAGLAMQPTLCASLWQRFTRAKIASLGDDLRNGRPADQDSAVNKIRDLTMARGNHEDVLAANILPDLMAAVKNPNSALQVRIAALACMADLMETVEAHEAVRNDQQGFMPIVLEAYKGKGVWGTLCTFGSGHAARLLANLAAQGDANHEWMLKCGAVDALLERCAGLQERCPNPESLCLEDSEGPEGQAPKVNEELSSVDAVYELCSTDIGRQAVYDYKGDVATGLANWAASDDHDLQEKGVGALARIAIEGGPAGSQFLLKTKCFKVLLEALHGSDFQAQCNASAAVYGVSGKQGSALQSEYARNNVIQKLLETLVEKNPEDRPTIIREHVQKCALKALRGCTRSPILKKALLKAKAVQKIQKLQHDGKFCTPEVVQAAEKTIEEIDKKE